MTRFSSSPDFHKGSAPRLVSVTHRAGEREENVTIVQDRASLGVRCALPTPFDPGVPRFKRELSVPGQAPHEYPSDMADLVARIKTNLVSPILDSPSSPVRLLYDRLSSSSHKDGDHAASPAYSLVNQGPAEESSDESAAFFESGAVNGQTKLDIKPTTYRHEFRVYAGYMIPLFCQQCIQRYSAVMGPVSAMGKYGSVALAGASLGESEVWGSEDIQASSRGGDRDSDVYTPSPFWRYHRRQHDSEYPRNCSYSGHHERPRHPFHPGSRRLEARRRPGSQPSVQSAVRCRRGLPPVDV